MWCPAQFEISDTHDKFYNRREGSPARSKALDLRSSNAGFRGFESHPSHFFFWDIGYSNFLYAIFLLSCVFPQTQKSIIYEFFSACSKAMRFYNNGTVFIKSSSKNIIIIYILSLI